MKVSLLTREYPPEVYGGAGVHVEYLARDLATLCDLSIECFGAPRSGASAHRPDPGLDGANTALQTLSVDLRMARAATGADLVHSHTWYANLGGHLAKMLHGVPHVMTTHSLEPLRPWKAQQLGGGYALSCWAERTAIEGADAIIAVSSAMRADVLATYGDVDPARVQVIHNGIDATQYRPDPGHDVLDRLGIDPTRSTVLFVGRITRQKGLTYLLRAAHHMDPAAQLVLCAGAPDTPELEAEVQTAVDALRSERKGVVWVRQMLPKPQVIQLLSQATVFVCPSIYEPMGIVNLEAMACETAVVASATGGIPEVVTDEVTGLLVPLQQPEPGAPPQDGERFVRDIAERVNSLLGDPDRARAMGQAGRRRALEHFSWASIAARTVRVYQSLA